MHLLVDEELTSEQLSSPKRYIYEICEMYGWELPEDVVSTPDGYKIRFTEVPEGKAKKRRRLIQDACFRLKVNLVENYIEPFNSYSTHQSGDSKQYCCEAVIPVYKKWLSCKS